MLYGSFVLMAIREVMMTKLTKEGVLEAIGLEWCVVFMRNTVRGKLKDAEVIREYFNHFNLRTLLLELNNEELMVVAEYHDLPLAQGVAIGKAVADAVHEAGDDEVRRLMQQPKLGNRRKESNPVISCPICEERLRVRGYVAHCQKRHKYERAATTAGRERDKKLHQWSKRIGGRIDRVPNPIVPTTRSGKLPPGARFKYRGTLQGGAFDLGKRH